MKPGKHLIGPDGNCSPNCYPCKLASVSFAASAMPTRHPEAARTAVSDKKLDADLAAYRRLRRNGEQPRSTRGAAELESRASEHFEIATGRPIADPTLRRHAKAIFEEMPRPSAKPMVRET